MALTGPILLLTRCTPLSTPAARPPPRQVIKVGTSSLIREDRESLNLSSLAGIVEVRRRAAGVALRCVAPSHARQGPSLNPAPLPFVPPQVVRDLRVAGFNVIIVSSGAVGVGCQRLGLRKRPDNIGQKQALAAVGQVCTQCNTCCFARLLPCCALADCLLWCRLCAHARVLPGTWW